VQARPVDYRNEHGRFNSIEDIQNVKGIKEGTFSKIKDYIRVRWGVETTLKR
jgi:competence protein ComEA